MAEYNKAILDKANEAITKGDNEGFLSFCTDDTEWTFVGDQTLKGKEAVRRYMATAYIEPPKFMVENLISGGDFPPADALIVDTGVRYDYVLANPPFGKKSSQNFTNAEGAQEKEDLTYNRQDFWATTSNKQLNFVQHIRSILKTTGRPAVCVV